jgi:biopolymer transport protein ExbD
VNRARPWDTPPRLEMLPLLDVVFLLLVVFLYSIVSMVRAHAVPVELPALSTGEQQQLSAVLVVSVRHGGEVLVAGEPADDVALAERVRALRAETPELAVLINADAGAPYGSVAAVLDGVRAAGQERVFLVGVSADGPPRF